MKKRNGMKAASVLGAAAAAVVGMAMVPSAADAATTHKASHVLAGYQKVIYRGDYYNGNYGPPAPTRGFWGKGTTGAAPQYGHGGYRHHRHHR